MKLPVTSVARQNGCPSYVSDDSIIRYQVLTVASVIQVEACKLF